MRGISTTKRKLIVDCSAVSILATAILAHDSPTWLRQAMPHMIKAIVSFSVHLCASMCIFNLFIAALRATGTWSLASRTALLLPMETNVEKPLSRSMAGTYCKANLLKEPPIWKDTPGTHPFTDFHLLTWKEWCRCNHLHCSSSPLRPTIGS